jgi:hypothetical protein
VGEMKRGAWVAGRSSTRSKQIALSPGRHIEARAWGTSVH